MISTKKLKSKDPLPQSSRISSPSLAPLFFLARDPTATRERLLEAVAGHGDPNFHGEALALLVLVEGQPEIARICI